MERRWPVGRDANDVDSRHRTTKVFIVGDRRDRPGISANGRWGWRERRSRNRTRRRRCGRRTRPWTWRHGNRRWFGWARDRCRFGRTRDRRRLRRARDRRRLRHRWFRGWHRPGHRPRSGERLRSRERLGVGKRWRLGRRWSFWLGPRRRRRLRRRLRFGCRRFRRLRGRRRLGRWRCRGFRPARWRRRLGRSRRLRRGRHTNPCDGPEMLRCRYVDALCLVRVGAGRVRGHGGPAQVEFDRPVVAVVGRIRCGHLGAVGHRPVLGRSDQGWGLPCRRGPVVVALDAVHVECAVRRRKRLVGQCVGVRSRTVDGRPMGRDARSRGTGPAIHPNRDRSSSRVGDVRSVLRTLHRRIGNAIAHGQPPMAPTLA
jgi:hypothetical protein